MTRTFAARFSVCRIAYRYQKVKKYLHLGLISGFMKQFGDCLKHWSELK